MMKIKRSINSIGIFSATACAFALVLSSCSDDKEPIAAPDVVFAAKIFKDVIASRTTFSGEVQPESQSEVSFRISGKITAVHVEVGQRVEKGQLLAELDDRQQKADLDIASAGLKAANAGLIRAQAAMQRQSSLFNQGVVARASLDEADEALKTSINSLTSAKSDLSTAQEALSYSRLVAEGSGVILSRAGEIGQIVREAQPVLVIAHGDGRQAFFNVPERVLLSQKQSDVIVALINNDSVRVEGRVTEISPSVDPQTGTLSVKVWLPGDASTFQFGAAVSGTFVAKDSNAVVLPWTALTSSAGFPAVWLIDPLTSKVSMRRVELGLYQTGSFQVLNGLQPGDLVVTEGGKMLRLGQMVTIREEVKK